MLASGIIATEVLSVITKCDIDKVSIFVADFFLSFQPENERSAQNLTDQLYKSIRSTPVPPEEYFTAFEKSRRLIKSKSLQPDLFLSYLHECLSLGFPIDNIFEEIQLKHNKILELNKKTIEKAVELYILDNGKCPSTEQGLQALIRAPTIGRQAKQWREGGYIDNSSMLDLVDSYSCDDERGIQFTVTMRQ
ncbi:MAG: hypothetical protein D3924_08875 [Candidatus Electrothrix sp. AR4]|nr:hypothetical protein [Candidatus Electrothrix sp. AR4]